MTTVKRTKYDTIRKHIAQLACSVIVIVLSLIASANAALFSDNLQGNISVTGVSSNAEDNTTKSLNQQYSVHWTKRILHDLDLRASMRYYDLNVDQSLGQNSWRTEYQPSGELTWKKHSYYINANVRRQKTSTSGDVVDLYRDNAGLMFATRAIQYPILSVRYDWSKTYNKTDIDGRDTRERVLRSSVDYNLLSNHLYYGLTLRRNENLLSELTTDEVRHVARWEQSASIISNRLTVGTDYLFSHYSQTTEVPVDGKNLVVVPISAALYAYDATPDIGSLDTLNSLGDGDTETPASPPIDLGDARPDHNVGVAFDFPREVSAIYIYTDRPSGSILNWRVFVSSDNLTWSPAGIVTSVAYNTSFHRYEITFEALTTRYIKVVNSGINDVEDVFLTEIEALMTATEKDKGTRAQAYHLANVNTRFVFSDALQSSFNVSYRKESQGDFSERQDRLYFAFSTRHQPTKSIRQVIGATTATEKFLVTGATNRYDNLSYVLKILPVEALEFTFSGNGRMAYLDHVKALETNNLLAQASGYPIPALQMTSSVSYTRDNRYDTHNKFDTWTYRLVMDGQLRRSLNAGVFYLHQNTDDLIADRSLLRLTYGGNFDFRPTRAILLRGTLTISDDNGLRYTYQEYNLSWSLTPKLSVGGLVTLTGGDAGVLSERNNVRMSYMVTRRSTLFASISRNRSGLSNLPETTSIQAGIKTGF